MIPLSFQNTALSVTAFLKSLIATKQINCARISAGTLGGQAHNVLAWASTTSVRKDLSKLRTELQRQASRLNGAKSRGPVTAEGKRRSSQNARRHGLYSKNALAEAPALPALPDEAPANPLAAAHHDHLRLVALEARIITDEIARQRPLHPDASPRILAAIAFRRLADETGVIEALFRLERAVLRRIENASEAADLLNLFPAVSKNTSANRPFSSLIVAAA